MLFIKNLLQHVGQCMINLGKPKENNAGIERGSQKKNQEKEKKANITAENESTENRDNIFSSTTGPTGPILLIPELNIDKLEPGNFPVIKNAGHIHNEVFHKHMLELAEEAYKAVEKYITLVMHIRPLARNPVFEQYIKRFVRNCIIQFWDMPSSKEMHDSKPWGHLIHSLVVAYRLADKLSRSNIMGQYGIDTEQTRKQRPYLTMGGFIAGMLHDSNKIYNYDLRANTDPRTIYYDPTRGSGSILQFMMKYPENIIQKGWKQYHATGHLFGLILFFNIVPKELRLKFSSEIYEYINSELNGVKSNADKEAAAYAHSKDSKILSKISEAIYEILLSDEPFNHRAGWGFKISENWYIVSSPTFLQRICNVISAVPDTIRKILIDNNIIFVPPNRPELHTFETRVRFRDVDNSINMHISLVKSEFIDKPYFAKFKKNLDIDVIFGIVDTQRKFFDNLGLPYPLPQSLFVPMDNKKNARPSERPVPSPVTEGSYPTTGGYLKAANITSLPHSDDEAFIVPEEASASPPTPSEVHPDTGEVVNPTEPLPEHKPRIPRSGLPLPPTSNFALEKSPEKTRKTKTENQPTPVPESPPKPSQALPVAPEPEDSPRLTAEDPEAQKTRRAGKEVPIERIKENISPEFYAHADEIAKSLFSAFANKLVLILYARRNKSIRSSQIFQKTCTEETLLYLSENGSIYARTPQIFQFSWRAFQEEIREEHHPWAQKISDLPQTFYPRDLIMNRFMKHCFYVWRGIGFVKASFGSTIFQLENMKIPLFIGFSKGNPIVQEGELNGHFIEIDIASMCFVQKEPTHPEAKYDNIFGYLHNILYHKKLLLSMDSPASIA
jgi:hypothetical protein